MDSTALIPATIRLMDAELIFGIITPIRFVFFVLSVWAWAEGLYPVSSITFLIFSFLSSLT